MAGRTGWTADRWTVAALVAVAVVTTGALAGCGGSEEATPVAADPTVLENRDLGYAVVVPPGSRFEPVSAEAGPDGDQIRLRFPGDDEMAEGTFIYDADEEQGFGVNLVDAVNQRKAEVEALPEGDFLGQLELGTEALGRAYSTRARFLADGREVEEVRIFAVHPSGDRLLHMTYRYPVEPGQTETRMTDHAFEALGYVQPLDGAEEPTPDPSGTEETAP